MWLTISSFFIVTALVAYISWLKTKVMTLKAQKVISLQDGAWAVW